MIPIRNVYYMLSYAFQALKAQGYCWTIAYNLTKDEQIRKLLDILPKAEEHD